MKRLIPLSLAAVGLVTMGFALAQLVPAKPDIQRSSDPPPPPGLVRTEDAVPTRGPWGEWLRYFRGDTYGTRDMVVLMVTLKPGEEPHPPHQHAEEEFMILTAGAGRWTLDGKEIAARKGDVVYAAPWKMHGLKNTGDAPLIYYMVKWNNKGVNAPEKPLGDK